MQCPADAGTYAYTYYSYPTSGNPKGVDRGVYVRGEYNSDGLKWNAAYPWTDVDLMKENNIANPFLGFNVSDMCRESLVTCGNGAVDAGENCFNCPSDAGCTGGKSCLPSGGSWQCGCVDSDGDGYNDNNCS